MNEAEMRQRILYLEEQYLRLRENTLLLTLAVDAMMERWLDMINEEVPEDVARLHQRVKAARNARLPGEDG